MIKKIRIKIAYFILYCLYKLEDSNLNGLAYWFLYSRIWFLARFVYPAPKNIEPEYIGYNALELSLRWQEYEEHD